MTRENRQKGLLYSPLIKNDKRYNDKYKVNDSFF